MPLPQHAEARRFYRAAYERFDDARYLLDHERTTGAVYLAGYGVECILKALIVSVTPSTRVSEVLDEFRGVRAHDYDWLLWRYLTIGGAHPPNRLRRHWIRVNPWSTDMRYATSRITDEEAQRFLESTGVLLAWADGRL